MAEEGLGVSTCKALSAAALDGIAVTVDGEIVHTNPALDEFLGRTDLVGILWQGLFASETVDRLAADVLPLQPDEQWRDDVTVRKARGTTVTAKLSIRRTGDGDALVWVLRDGTDAAKLDQFETIIETVEDGIYSLDENLEFEYANTSLREMVGRPAGGLVGESVADFFVYDDEYAFAEEVRDRVVSGDTSVGTVQGSMVSETGKPRYLETCYRLHPEPDGSFEGSVGVIRDVTERVEREREIETLNRINELLLDTVREAMQTTTRDAVEETVCEHLLHLDRYSCAWIADRPPDGGEIVPRTTVGGDDSSLDDVWSEGEATDGRTSLVESAIRDREVRIETSESRGGSEERSTSADRGFNSGLAAPIQYGDTVYSALVVYSTDTDAFSEREQAGFATVGKTIGYVVNAIKTRQLLFADSVVELEFEVDDEDETLFRTAKDLGCTLTLAGMVTSGSTTLAYFDVGGVDAHRFVPNLEDDDEVSRSRVIDDEGEVHRVELAYDESFVFDTVLASGATVESARIDPGGGHIAVETPASADVRELITRIQSEFDHADLLAKRRLDRPPIPGGIDDDAFDALTDRQWKALEIAFHAGYFDWPRASTAEEVADTMDITASTLHYHLRKAENSLVRGIIEEM